MPINVFGAGAVQTAYVSYSEINLTSNLQLNWPFSYQDNPNLVTAVMDVINAAETAWNITLPKASEASVGQNFIIRNKGSSNFNLLDHGGTNIGTIMVGVSYYYYLADNTTDAGDWQSITFGAGTAQADATDLAGNGLTPIAGLLNTNIPVVTTAGPNFIVNPSERANLIVWIGGTGTLTLPPIGSVPNGYYFAFNNEGSGVVTISGDTTLDNISGTLVEIGQSLMIISDGTKWWSLGFGQQTFFSVSVLNKDVSGNANITLTAAEADKSIIQFQGTLTGNITVFFPVAPNQWSIFNNTTGPYTLTIQLVGGTSLFYTIPQDNRQIFYSDGTQLYNTPTIVNPSAITFPNGNVSNPGMAFTNSPSTGFYLTQPTGTENDLNISVGNNALASFQNQNGTTNVNLNASGVISLTSTQNNINGPTTVQNLKIQNNFVLQVPNGTLASPFIQRTANSTTGLSYNNDTLNVLTNGVNTTNLGSAGVTTIAVRVNAGTVAQPSITSGSDTSSGMYFPSAGTIGFASGGTSTFTINNTGLIPATPTIRQTTFNNLSPTTTAGDMIARNSAGNDVRIPASIAANEVLLSRVGDIPIWGGYSVLQVQSFVLQTGQTYVAPSTGFTNTELTLSITPTSPLSKILVLVTYNGCTDTNGVNLGLLRNGTIVTSALKFGLIAHFYKLGSDYYPMSNSFTFLDSPASTAACAYTVITGAALTTTNVYSNQSSNGTTASSSITLIEIGGF